MIRALLTFAAVVLAALGGGVGAAAIVDDDHRLSVGTVRMHVDPGHAGALDLYVPVVDWGLRFGGVRLPARLGIDARSVDRGAAEELARGAEFDVRRVRGEAEDAIASFIRLLAVVVLGGALAAGALVALAVRSPRGPRLRWTLAAAGATAVLSAAAVVLLLPPRGDLGDPEYYANGTEFPRALDAIERVERSSTRLDEELDAQLVGLARLVGAPGTREPLAGRPRMTVASDLHNNFLALPALERAARGAPLFLVGDLSDTGSPLENRLVGRVAGAGRPVVMVAGNHDSDTTERELARAGAVVLTRDGRLRPGQAPGPVVAEVAGLRVAGYDDPDKRLRRDGYRDRGAQVTTADQGAFAAWLRPLVNVVDVVLVHSPALAGIALDELRSAPPDRPLLVLTGHTHRAALERIGTVTVVNGGSVGGGGAANVSDGSPIGIAALTYRTRPRFSPLAADLVEIDAGDGSARAQRFRLDGDEETG